MSERFCSYCQRFHPESEMRRFRTGSGVLKWRCIASIEAAKASQSERDQYGRQITERNSRATSEIARAAAASRQS